MYNTPPSNLMHGIQLVQMGHKAEALPFLREASRSERLTAEGWLWLAAATDDRAEYEHCVRQALKLDRFHPVAQKMRDEMDRQDRLAEQAQLFAHQPQAAGTVPYAAYQPPAPAWPYPAPAEPEPRRRSRLRYLLWLLPPILIVGGIVALVATGTLADLLESLDVGGGEDTGSAVRTVTIGTDPVYSFQVEVPSSWLPADTDNPQWQTVRQGLDAAFPVESGQISVWSQVDESFSTVERDPVYGGVLPNVRLVETDVKKLEKQGVVVALTLQEIVPLPDAPEGTICDRLRLLEQQFQANGMLNSLPDNEVIAAELVRRQSDDNNCVYTIHRRYTNQSAVQVVFPVTFDRAPSSTRSLFIAVPVGDERYASWVMTFADTGYDTYKDAIDRIISSISYVPPE